MNMKTSAALITLLLSLTVSVPITRADRAGHQHNDAARETIGEPQIVEFSWDRAAAEGVTFVAAGPGKLERTIPLNGEISLNGDSIVHVAARFPGVLKRVAKNLGDIVRTGELLAVVQSNESLSVYEIRSEVPGTIIEKDATRGEFVRDDKNLFTIADLSSVWVNAAVYPKQLTEISVGMPMRISSRSSAATATAPISYLRPSLSEVTRTSLARVVLRNDTQEWIPGMFVKVDVLLTPQSASLVVPNSAIQLIANRHFVFLKANGPDGDQAFRPVEVRTARTDDTHTEITDGLSQGDVLAAGNTYIIKAELGKSAAGHED